MSSKHFRFLVVMIATASISLSLLIVAAHVRARQKALGFKDRGEAAAPSQTQEKSVGQQAGANVEDAINKRPLKDWLRKVREANNRGEFNGSETAEIVIAADREADGNLSNPVVLESKGDPKLVQYALDYVSALSDSRSLRFLKETDHYRFSFNLTEAELRFALSYDVETPERATQMAKSYNMLFYVGAKTKRDAPEGIIYKSLNVSANERRVVVSLNMQRKDALDLLNKLSLD